ncbi:YnfA family protein [Marinimicrobium sp. LS-A18]|uniref:YnfA family protein n=1 Tax=Marinimicrobium sp. LS-A18 TaxID=1381596 RepID=UPI000467B89A|nr:YnfA family protein [Marinimicrobium sp. LS-A18]
MTFIWFILAALAEIAGCYTFWMWLRLDRSAWWLVPGVISLCLFAFFLTRADAELAGRAFAAYGGVYIAASLGWMALVEHRSPQLFDYLGALVCIGGAALILYGGQRLGG